MSAEWVPVFIGSVSDVLVLRATLDAHGIPCMSPDVDHMDTATQGGNVFAVRLLVPLERLANATRLIPASKRGGIPAAAGPSAAKHSQPLP